MSNCPWYLGRISAMSTIDSHADLLSLRSRSNTVRYSHYR
jgi:hypothetical protein